MAEINWWAVLVAAFGSFLLGGPWYSKALFLNAWQREAGDTRVPGADKHPARSSALPSCSRWSRRHASRSSSDRGPRCRSPWLRPAGRCGHGRGQLWHQLPVRQPQPHPVADRRRLPHRAVSFVWLGARPLALTRMTVPVEHFDVLIVGAGLSGIGAAWHLQDRCPTKSYAILEGREASGGTWDLFRYPGVRSDSDMYTLGYRFRPWKEAKAIADGPSILKYIREVASDHGIDGKIRYRHRVVAASWSTPEARWTVEVERGEAREPARFTCNFLWMCSGYYRTDVGLPAGVPRHRALQGPGRPSAEMDRRHRLCRQEGRGDRQRRHGGDPGAGDGRQRRRARHHAAALADLHGGAAVAGSVRDQDAQAPAAEGGLRRHALEERAVRHVLLSALPAPAGEGEERAAGLCAPDAGAGLRCRQAFHAELQSVGPAALPGARRRFLPRDPPRQGLGRHRPHRDASPRPASS